MREEMTAALAKFFKENGLLSRPEYRQRKDVPYTLRQVERVFKNFAVMLYQVEQYNIMNPKDSEQVAPPVPPVQTPTVTTEEQDEDLLDE